MKQINKEILETMNGCEILSMKYEGCVGVRGKDVISFGEIIDTLDTDEKVSELWAEFLEQEGI